MQAKRIIAVAVLVLIAFLIVYPPLANSSVKVALSPSSTMAVEHLYVTVEEIRAHRADTREPEGWFVVSNQTTDVDLAAVDSTQTVGLGQVSLGQYDMIRVRIANATAIVNNTSKRVQLVTTVFSVPVSFLVRLGAESLVTLKVAPELSETPEAMTLKLSFTAATGTTAP